MSSVEVSKNVIYSMLYISAVEVKTAAVIMEKISKQYQDLAHNLPDISLFKKQI